MQIAFGRLRLPPAVFWSMSLAEWTAALKGLAAHYGAASGAAPGEVAHISREDSEALVQKYYEQLTRAN